MSEVPKTETHYGQFLLFMSESLLMEIKLFSVFSVRKDVLSFNGNGFISSFLGLS